jgi:hypothetical protein
LILSSPRGSTIKEKNALDDKGKKTEILKEPNV